MCMKFSSFCTSETALSAARDFNNTSNNLCSCTWTPTHCFKFHSKVRYDGICIECCCRNNYFTKPEQECQINGFICHMHIYSWYKGGVKWDSASPRTTIDNTQLALFSCKSWGNLAILQNSTTESLLTGCIWFGNCSAHSHNSLQRVVKAVQHILGNGFWAFGKHSTSTVFKSHVASSRTTAHTLVSR